MANPPALTHARPVALADVVALTKPRITRMVVFTAAAGMWLAPAGTVHAATLIAALIGTVMVVSSANALNMYLERDIDAQMVRTANRPLPSGRMHPSVALGVGMGLALFAVPLLSMLVNPITSLLGTLALVIYVWGYTPLKQRSWFAVVVGAVPGALPPLMGWTAATGKIGAPGVALFAIMFFWQIPHTLAITIFRDAEYRKAGFQTLPVQRSIEAARWQTLVWTVPLVASSVAPFFLGFAGWPYLAVAIVLGAGFLVQAVRVVREAKRFRQARTLFFYSIAYATVLFATLLVVAGHVKG